jgi:hypothetical protein
VLHFEHKVIVEKGVRVIVFVVENKLKIKRKDERTKQM